MKAWLALILVGCGTETQAPAPHCSTMSMLGDSFATLSSWWQPSVTTDAITITPGDGLAIALGDVGSGGVTATHYLDLREDSFAVAVDGDASATLQLASAGDAQDAVSITRAGGTLHFTTDVDGLHTELAALPYDPVAQRYWRIANTGGVTTWSTSPDGVAFTQQASTSKLDWVTYMQPTLSATRTDGEPATMARFLDVNGGVATGDACPASDLRDDFSSPSIQDHWHWSAELGSLSPQDGQLEAYFPANVSVSIQLASSTLYDLREGELAFELPTAIPSTAGVYITVTTLAGAATGLTIQADQIEASIPTLPPPPDPPSPTHGHLRAATNYDPIANRWFRIRTTADLVMWETSPDGQAYTTLKSFPSLGGLERTSIAFRFNGSSASFYDPAIIALDNFNVY